MIELLHASNCKPLADYFDDLISVIQDLSFSLDARGDLIMLPHFAYPYKETKKFKNQLAHHLRFFRFSNRSHVHRDDLTMDEFFNPDAGPSQTHPRMKLCCGHCPDLLRNLR